MPRIKIRLSRFEKNPIAISAAMPGDRKANRGKAAITLFPNGQPVEMDVTHEHLAYLIGDRAVDVDILDKGEKIIPPELQPKKAYDFPWQEAQERRAASDKEYAEEQERKAEVERLQAERDEKLKQGIQPGGKSSGGKDAAPTK